MSCPLPRIGDSRTVRQVVDAHAAHGTRYGPLELGASWNTLGKLVRQQSEKHVLRGAPAMLQPLAEHTEQVLPKFGARLCISWRCLLGEDEGGEPRQYGAQLGGLAPGHVAAAAHVEGAERGRAVGTKKHV